MVSNRINWMIKSINKYWLISFKWVSKSGVQIDFIPFIFSYDYMYICILVYECMLCLARLYQKKVRKYNSSRDDGKMFLHQQNNFFG